ncbi:hypothetical protein FRT60_07720 [Pseudomonas haemolytica]|uniref:NACHT-associated inactive Restriction Endonuclease 2 domain-containing protein n=1 Tax=Pseudomonas haemolytica TaxID=2600065 RepID=A0A646NTZ1_9PSED|nr:hypothetical protein [Pseudomonas haemolytica]MRJ20226.1 hypothetical protein [Pseudomonas haemolytica]
MNVELVKTTYLRYGFSLIEERADDGLLAFLLITGPFRNVEIVKVRADANADLLEQELLQLGYACKVLAETEAVEQRLFESFFSVSAYRKKISRDYNSFTTAISRKYSDYSEYSYLSAPYLINGVPGVKHLSEEILSRIEDPVPMIFVVEAAAGYGKTCAAYELASKINEMSGRIPLLAELSKNRQARIFKHVLLDEIDRSFPNLSSRLIKDETASGRIVTILDGFDELLRDNEDSESDFDSKEPMLETIGEYLKGNAKIILTTRKTILFDGDGFHKWVENNKSDFSLVKIQINEPKVNDWLDSDRRELLERSGVEIASIANPVLLSFLRYISFEELSDICSNPEGLVDSYFKFILERERIRQELEMSADEQNSILDIVAHDMITDGYKSEDRSYIMELILSEGIDLIESCVDRYPSDKKTTVEGIANKLASHAFLDRSSRNPTKIEFINEFVFGHYVARDINKTSGWINDDWRYIGPAIFSYRTRSFETRKKLWDLLGDSLEFVSLTNRVSASLSLLRSLDFEVADGEVNGLTFQELSLGRNHKVRNVQFNGCQFTNCTFHISLLSDVSFFECKFFSCVVFGEIYGGRIHTPGCEADNDLLDIFAASRTDKQDAPTEDKQKRAEAAVLEKFWPVGRDYMMHKHRPIRGICNFADSGAISPQEMYDAIESLRKRGVLSEPRSSLFVEVNLGEINEIKRILGR